MNEFENIDHLNQVFSAGQFSLPESIVVSGLSYRLHNSLSHPIPDMVKQGKKDFVIYSLDPASKRSETWQSLSQQPVEQRPVNEWIVLIWAIDRTLSIRPARVASTTPARAKTDMDTATNTLGEAEGANVIPDHVDIRFLQFNRQAPGKVDTGANLSSLHCEEWRVIPGKNMVEFRSSLLSDNTIRTELHDQVAIQTSEGSEYRPVISLNVAIAGKQMQNCKFNLNDRSQMQDKILVGQNILEQGKFLVDPNKQHDRFESVDWNALQEQFKDISIVEESVEDKRQKTDELYKLLLNSDVSMADLVRHIKTIAYDTLEETDTY